MIVISIVHKSKNEAKTEWDTGFANPEDRANMPTIRGGLNGSIADILEASGYGTETDFRVDEDVAIQGMLSMSQSGSHGFSLSALAAHSPSQRAAMQRLQVLIHIHINTLTYTY